MLLFPNLEEPKEENPSQDTAPAVTIIHPIPDPSQLLLSMPTVKLTPDSAAGLGDALGAPTLGPQAGCHQAG